MRQRRGLHTIQANRGHYHRVSSFCLRDDELSGHGERHDDPLGHRETPRNIPPGSYAIAGDLTFVRLADNAHSGALHFCGPRNRPRGPPLAPSRDALPRRLARQRGRRRPDVEVRHAHERGAEARGPLAQQVRLEEVGGQNEHVQELQAGGRGARRRRARRPEGQRDGAGALYPRAVQEGGRDPAARAPRVADAAVRVHGPHRTPHLAPRQLHARLPRRVPQPRRLRLLRRGPCRRVRLPGAGQGHGRDHAYDRYMVQAGDFGAMIGHMMCALLPDSCRAYHTNFDGCFIPTPGVELPPPTPFEKDRLDRSRAGFESDGRGYFAIQSTRPQSLAYGLSDSPAGLLAWIGKFFHEIVDLRGGDGDFSPSMSYDHLLTNVMVYWVTNTISSSVRQYYNFVNTDDAVIAATTKLPQPVAVAAFPMEIHAQHRAAVQHRCVQDVRWTEFEFGGHFASLERPQDLVGDVRAFAAEPRVKAALAGTEEKL